ncbi:HAD family hydrolase [Desmospora profundinema]|nr:HAD family hydrolase [Desmospora profundinema]
MLNYTMFVSDIDGTLVTQTKNIPVANQQSISAFREQGGYFTLATGRSYLEAKRFIQELKVDLPVILCNGAVLFDPATKELKAVSSVERGLLFRLLTQLETWGQEVEIFIYSLDRIYATRISPPLQEALKEHDDQFPLELIPTYDDLPDVPVIKVVAVAAPHTMPKLHRWSDSLNYPLETVQSSENFFEILPGGTSKGNAMEQIAKRYRLTIDQCAAIGDHLNDLSMVRKAGLSAAVANAHPELIQAAHHVVPSNEEAGVSHFLNQYVIHPRTAVQGG